MESLTEVILITLFIWAGVAMIKKGSRKKQVPSCHVHIYLSFPLQRFFLAMKIAFTAITASDQ